MGGRITSNRGYWYLPGLVALAMSPCVASAQEITKRMCVESHVKAQSQRLEGRLVESQQSLRTCANRRCPDIVQRDCIRWLEEIQGEVPTVVFEASDENGPLRDVTVTHEGQLLAEGIDGTSVELNPGKYVFVFVTADGRSLEKTVFIRQGDHNRSIAADFSAPTSRDTTWTLRVPPAARVTAGVTIVAGATAVAMGASALIDQSNALDSCAPDCKEQRGERIVWRAAFADVTGGIAVVAGVVTVILVAKASGKERAARSARVAPVVNASKRSAGVGLRGTF